MKTIFLSFVMLFCFVGCKLEDPNREEVRIVHYQEAVFEKDNNGKVRAHRTDYTVLESVNTKIRYYEPGKIGEVGEVFIYDTANSNEL